MALPNLSNFDQALDFISKAQRLANMMKTGQYLDPITGNTVTFDPTNPLDPTTIQVGTNLKNLVSSAISKLQST